MDSRKGFYLSVIAVLISFCAAGFSWWQLVDARKHNRISVKPVLLVTAYMEGPGGRNGVFLSNQGLGPGVLTGINVEVHGRSFTGLGENQWAAVLTEAETNPGCFKHGWPVEGAVVVAGAELALLTPTAANRPECSIAAMLLQMRKAIEITIEYKSLYDEPFSSAGSAKINVDF